MGASALDFDGVICDSINECCNTSYEAMRRCHTYSSLPSQMKSEWRSLFYLNRGVVRPARDYFKLWKWILDPAEDHDLHLSALSHISFPTTELHEFESAFFAERISKINKHLDAFIGDNPIYDEIVQAWSQIPRPIYIVTTKDELSTRTLLTHYGLEIDGLFSKDSGSKPDALRMISRIHNLAIQDVRFVDDNPEHVQDARSTGATCGLIGWGYGPYLNSPPDIISSAEELITFLSHE
jgi:phosphoglycolate phosphatase-like HAD superfamily hydrolase